MSTDIAGNITVKRQLQTDFVVVGGGMSGVSAALAAARNGIRVVLIQDRSMLGGNASSEVKMHIVGADCHGGRPGSRESGLIEELKLEDAYRNPHRSYSQWDLLLYEKVKAEPNITLLLDTACVGCIQDPATREIRTISALRNSTEELFEISARLFADCSGDSRLAMEARADSHVGRESRDQYGESMAQPVADNHTLGSSILITGREYPTPQPFHCPGWVRKFTEAEFKYRPIRSYEYGYWWFEWGGQIDTLKDNEIIRHELLRIALGVWDYVKNSGAHPGAANWALDWVGSIPAKRETRRLRGPHILVQSDMEAGRLFPDAIAYGGWHIDVHPPQGVDAPNERPCTQIELDQLYTIPLRALYSRNISNLFFAGRNISASHVAFASTRVMATCSVMGQAVGAAAAIVCKDGVSPQEIAETKRVKKLQQMLLKDDAFIPGLRNEDPDDHALRCASITASSSKEGCAPELVIDGITRDLTAPRLGPWADGNRHAWESKDLPGWLELKWAKPIEIREIHLTFDSGFQRELILSCSDSLTKKIVRGAQPETVKSYEVLAGDRIIASEINNYLRKRIHRLASPVTTSTLRINVTATHGIPTARIFEVRVY
jgi:hypothetical protein